MSKQGCQQGQVVVEMLLILPVFMTIVFTIMEMGFIAFHMILLNHATYEVARVGGMTWADGKIKCGQLDGLMKRIILSASVSCRTEDTMHDEQARQMNQDLIVTGSDKIKLIFPFSSWMLSDVWGGGHRTLNATVRMPIERPLTN